MRTLALFSCIPLLFAACKSDGESSTSSDTSAETESGETETGGTIGDSESTTDSGTTDDTAGSASGSATSTGTSGTTTGGSATDGGQDCETCVAEHCEAELAACLEDENCTCWAGCLSMGGTQVSCSMECGPPSQTTLELETCVGSNCSIECGDTGGTGGSGDGAAYDPCQSTVDCQESLQCVFTVGYCSPTCMAAADCPAPETGDVTPTCPIGTCSLPCTDQSTCPDGMTCQGMGPAMVCAY